MECPACDHELSEHGHDGCTVEGCDCGHGTSERESSRRAELADELGVDEDDLDGLDEDEIEDML